MSRVSDFEVVNFLMPSIISSARLHLSLVISSKRDCLSVSSLRACMSSGCILCACAHIPCIRIYFFVTFPPSQVFIPIDEQNIASEVPSSRRDVFLLLLAFSLGVTTLQLSGYYPLSLSILSICRPFRHPCDNNQSPKARGEFLHSVQTTIPLSRYRCKLHSDAPSWCPQRCIIAA